MLGTLAGFSYLANKILRETPRRLWRYANRKNFAILLYRYREFPTYGLFSSLAAAIARNLPIILLSYFFSAATVGFFSVAFRIVAGPFQLGAVSVTNVFYQKSNEARKDGNLGEVTKQTFERLAAIFMTPLMLLSIGAAEIVVLLLGDKWAPTASYLSWLCLWFFFIAIASPLHRLFAVLERQSELAILNGMLFVFSAGGLITGGLMEDPQMAVILFCLASSFIWMAQGVRTMKIGGAGGLNYFRLIFLELAKSAPFGAALYAGRILTDDIFAVTGMTLCLLAIFGVLRVKFILGRKIKPLGMQKA
jgi:O-antigen/teichoic acid export membrane protein